MEISWLGHACFRLRIGNVTLLTDPFPHSLGIPFGHPTAHIVTVSNSHPHHSNFHDVAGDPKVVQWPGEYEIQGFFIRGFPSDAAGGEGYQNTAYLIQVEGLTLCHLGDLAWPLPDRLAGEFRAKDILFLPVGGDCTLSATEAARLVHLLEPRVVVPMHFALAGLQINLEGVEPFLRALGVREAEPQSRVSLSRSSLPRERRVLVFQPSP